MYCNNETAQPPQRHLRKFASLASSSREVHEMNCSRTHIHDSNQQCKSMKHHSSCSASYTGKEDCGIPKLTNHRWKVGNKQFATILHRMRRPHLERSEKDAVLFELSFLRMGSPVWGKSPPGGSVVPDRGSAPLDVARSNGEGDCWMSAIVMCLPNAGRLRHNVPSSGPC